MTRNIRNPVHVFNLEQIRLVLKIRILIIKMLHLYLVLVRLLNPISEEYNNHQV